MAKQKTTAYRNLDVGVTGAVVRAAPCKIASYYIFNASAALRYLKLYNKATAAAETDTPVKTLPIPAGQGANLVLKDLEWGFDVGLSIRATTGVADNDTGAPTANDVIVNIDTVDHLGYTL